MNPENPQTGAQKVSIVVGCMIERDGKYLMVQEQIPEKGPLWHPPSGKVESGEDLESAAVRRIKEQTGFDVKLHDEIGLFHEVATKSIKHVYSAEIIGGEAHPHDEILKVEWLPFAEIEMLNRSSQLRAPWVWSIVQQVRSKGASGSDLLKYM